VSLSWTRLSNIALKGVELIDELLVSGVRM